MKFELMYCSNCHEYLPWSEDFRNDCVFCHSKTTVRDFYLTNKEMIALYKISKDEDFIFAMEKLKQDDIVEFNLKMAQFKQSVPQEQDNTPKCPTCGSTNIKKISPTKRWVSTGLFGVASSLVTHTMECNDCGYKF